MSEQTPIKTDIDIHTPAIIGMSEALAHRAQAGLSGRACIAFADTVRRWIRRLHDQGAWFCPRCGSVWSSKQKRDDCPHPDAVRDEPTISMFLELETEELK